MDLTVSFYYLDEYCKAFEKSFDRHVLSNGANKRKRKISLSLSEVVTILIYYHASGYKTFKDYYVKCHELKGAFPSMPKYNRFIELQQKAVIALSALAKCMGSSYDNGIAFIDSFSLSVSHIKRASSHRTFKQLAAKGKTSVGWFFGFKLHLVVSSEGEIIDFALTPGNVADNNENVLQSILKLVNGKVFGDKGYLINKELFQKLYSNGVHIVTKLRKNMRNILMDLSDKLILKKRGMIESVGAILKSSCDIEHSRYRSPITLLINVLAGLIAYSFRKNKPSIKQADFMLS